MPIIIHPYHDIDADGVLRHSQHALGHNPSGGEFARHFCTHRQRLRQRKKRKQDRG